MRRGKLIYVGLVTVWLGGVALAQDESLMRDALGRPIETIRHDLLDVVRGSGTFGALVRLEEFHQGRLVQGRRMVRSAQAPEAAFREHWGSDFVVSQEYGVLTAVSRKSRRCAAQLSATVQPGHLSGRLFDAVHALMVRIGHTDSPSPGSTLGPSTSGSEHAGSAMVDLVVTEGATVQQVLNQMLAEAGGGVGWLLVERDTVPGAECQLAFMTADSVIWTTYDLRSSAARAGR